MALSLGLLLGSWGPARAQAVDAEADFAGRIAQERAANGLPALAPVGDLQSVARRQAQRMADRGEPYHNPNLATEVTGWSMLAENVGVGPDVASVHQRFMESSQHREAILSPDLTEVGVGVVQTTDGQLWVVEVFRRPDAAPTPPPTTAPPAPAPAASPPAPPPPAPAPTTTVVPPPAVTTSTVPAVDTVSATATTPVPLVRSAAAGRLTVAASPVVVLPDAGALARRVPPAAWVAALLLALVVGFQGQVLRRLELVP